MIPDTIYSEILCKKKNLTLTDDVGKGGNGNSSHSLKLQNQLFYQHQLE